MVSSFAVSDLFTEENLEQGIRTDRPNGRILRRGCHNWCLPHNTLVKAAL